MWRTRARPSLPRCPQRNSLATTGSSLIGTIVGLVSALDMARPTSKLVVTDTAMSTTKITISARLQRW